MDAEKLATKHAHFLQVILLRWLHNKRGYLQEKIFALFKVIACTEKCVFFLAQLYPFAPQFLGFHADGLKTKCFMLFLFGD
jgi:hypothetical protein